MDGMIYPPPGYHDQHDEFGIWVAWQERMEALHNDAKSYLTRRDWKRAEPIVETLLVESSIDLAPFYDDEALEEMESSWARWRSRWRSNLAGYRFRQGRWGDARAVWQRAAEEDNLLPSPWFGLWLIAFLTLRWRLLRPYWRRFMKAIENQVAEKAQDVG